MKRSQLFAYALLVLAAPLSARPRTMPGPVRAQSGPPAASFQALPDAGPASLEVQFSDTSTGPVTAWDWDFGDGWTSNVQHPRHTYLGPGSYTVTLTVSGPNGADTRVEADRIDVRSIPDGFSDDLLFVAKNQTAGFHVLGENDYLTWTKAGQVWRWVNGDYCPEPLADLTEEVGNWNDHGLHGFQLDPQYASNGYVYLYYVVDRHHLDFFGTPSYDPDADDFATATIGRITRYQVVDPSDPATTIDPATRTVLVGQDLTNGIPICGSSHGVGTLAFGHDGTLLFSTGDSAVGTGVEPECLADGVLRPKEYIQAFRSQLLDSASGKLHRILPSNGAGHPSNPFYDPADPFSWTSRVWTLGLRQPFRFTVRPESHAEDALHSHPGTIYLGDVGAATFEELTVIRDGGENHGWPFYEGYYPGQPFLLADEENQDAPNPLYPALGCNEFFLFEDLLVEDTLNPPVWPNPCDLSQSVPPTIPTFVHTRPAISWSRSDQTPLPVTLVKGYTSAGTAMVHLLDSPGAPVSGLPFHGNISIGGTWMDGGAFPPPFDKAYFHADYGYGWIKAFCFDDDDTLTAVHEFASALHLVVYLTTDPDQTALYYLRYGLNEVRRIRFGTNAVPKAELQVAPTFGPSPLRVELSAAGSSDPEGAPLDVAWDFGDGSTPTPLNARTDTVHVYPSDDLSSESLALSSKGPVGLAPLLDGVFPPRGSTNPAPQVRVDGTGARWVGMLFSEPRDLHSLVFQEGLNRGPFGGSFRELAVEIYDPLELTWTPVTDLKSHPEYPSSLSESFETFHLSFETVRASGVRLREAAPRARPFAALEDPTRRPTSPDGQWTEPDVALVPASTTSSATVSTARPDAITVAELRPLALPKTLAGGPQSHVIGLRVTDDARLSATASALVSTDNTPPRVQILSPADGSTYPVGATLTVPLVANLQDAEHGPAELECAWNVYLVHDNHIHPEPLDPNCTTSFELIPHDELQGDTIYWVVELTVTDTAGLSTTVSSRLLPEGDCNLNGVPDAQEIATGAAQDQNGNGVPDSCERPAPLGQRALLPRGNAR